jgi:hypothetical protein
MAQVQAQPVILTLLKVQVQKFPKRTTKNQSVSPVVEPQGHATKLQLTPTGVTQ